MKKSTFTSFCRGRAARVAAWPLIMLAACGIGFAQPPKSLVIINAASGAPVVAPDSIASAFGKKIGASTANATSPVPMLGGVSLNVIDSTNASLAAGLFYVAPNQINFVVPGKAATGAGTVDITNGSGTPMNAPVQVAAVAPGLFTANGAGVGVAAAIAIRHDLATQANTQVPVFHCDANGCSSVGITVGPGAQIFLELFGTGIRGASSLANVTATIGGETVNVLFAGAQGQFPGLDQVNVSLPTSFQPHGEQDIVLTVDGVVANKVRVNLQRGMQGN